MRAADGDHVDFSGGTFNGEVIGKNVGREEHHHHYPRPEPAPGRIVEGDDIPGPPPAFQPREDLLARVHAAHAGVRGAAAVCAVIGAPGVGKTLLAASYAWDRQAAGWPLIIWISAETEDRILAGLDALATRLGVRGADDDAATAARRARAWLAACTEPGLVVFDNAADVALVRRWCPATGAVRVLVTSRNRAFGRHCATVEVEVFTPGQARAYLAERTGRDDADGAAELAAELGHLPLALAQAASFVSRRHLTYAGYLQRLRSFPLEQHLRSRAEDAYPAGTAQAILLSVAQAEGSVEGARETLETLAVLSPAGIPRTLLHAAANPAGTPSGSAGETAGERLDEILADLADAALIGFSADGSAVLMHRLVQRVLRERAHHDDRLRRAVDDATGLLEAFASSVPYGAAVWGARAEVETLHEHIDVLYAVARSAGLLTPALMGRRGECGIRLAELADFARALPLLRDLLGDYERVLGDGHPDTVIGRYFLAEACRAAGRLAEAVPLYERTWADGERVLGPDHPYALANRYGLAEAYRAAGRLAEAVPLHERTWADRARLLGGAHRETLTSADKVASVYEETGRLDDALLLYRAVLDVRERTFGPDDPDTLVSRNNLANAYREAGRPEEAISLCQDVLATRERVLGPEHPHTLISRSNLAGAYLAAGRPDDAVLLHERVLEVRERVLGPEHPRTLVSRSNLAEARRAAGLA
ncbi:tetratricopeptide repeat protein [Planomonospora parontospora]|uniref:tetratricopeptide repeat protein n=1 Tax=Planomonospora parontospora TaxID=58119 RepID=UPI0016709312|nr:tetratricopeptide repeat protein [Planomonospora parontospora]GGL04713.1 hypothetical protein GCM10014719_03690 [Planomonospora parontospora subsp. antibiotica]GII13528.1 hypothetical protein Ppa05_02540 [Planomonospora parontospora subsp. antibiotica]